MTSISYETIFSYFLGNVTDYQIASLEEEDANAMMIEYLHKTVADPNIYCLFESVSLDDENLLLSYQMAFEINEDIDEQFLINILSKGMVCEWCRPKVRSRINLNQMFAGKEQNFFSQASHLSELRNLLEDTEVEIDRLIKKRGYVDNTYLQTD